MDRFFMVIPTYSKIKLLYFIVYQILVSLIIMDTILNLKKITQVSAHLLLLKTIVRSSDSEQQVTPRH